MTSEVMVSKAISLYHKKEYKISISIMTQAIIMMKQNSILGKNNLSLVIAMNNIGIMYFKSSNYEMAIKNLKIAFEECEKVVSKVHPLYQTIKNNYV